MNDELICVYCNANWEGSVQHLVNVQKKDANTDEYYYIQGWSVLQDNVKTLRSDRVFEIFDTVEEAQQRLSELDVPSPRDRPSKSEYHVSRPDTFDICFTGFKKADKEELIKLAKENNINIHVSVVQHLDMLCYGYNAGPVKLKKALSQGALIASRAQFENFLETGEIPEDA